MGDISKKLLGLFLGISLSLGVGAGLGSVHKEASEVRATGQEDWTQIATLEDINADDCYVIATNNKGNYFNGSVKNGHFQTTGFSKTTPVGATADGVIKFEANGDNIWKMKLVSTSNYVTATKASSGSGSISSTNDSYGWKFSVSEGYFDAIYQYSSAKAYLRSYNDTQFRTYYNTSGYSFTIFKYDVKDITKPSLNLNTDEISFNSLLVGESYSIPFTVNNVTNAYLTITFDNTDASATVNWTTTDSSGIINFTTPAQDKLTEDTSIKLSAVLTSTSDATINITQEKTFKILIPVLELNLDKISVREGNEATLTITTLKNFGDNPTIDAIVTDDKASVTIKDKTITFKGLTVGTDIAVISVTSESKNQEITKDIDLEITELDLSVGYFTKVTSLDDLTSGTYLLTGVKNSLNYVFNGADANQATSATEENNMLVCDDVVGTVRVNLIPTGTTNTTTKKYFYIQIDTSRISDTTSDAYKNNGNYLGAVSKSLGIDSTQKEHEFTYSSNAIHAKYTSGESTYELRYNSNNTSIFRYYTSGQNDIILYRYVPVSAKQYAEELKSILANPCSDASADNQSKVNAVWIDLKVKFTGLSETVQAELKEESSTDAIVQEALATYEHIVKRYGVEDFMGKGIDVASSNTIYRISGNNTPILIVILVATISITVVGGYFFIRKKRVN